MNKFARKLFILLVTSSLVLPNRVALAQSPSCSMTAATILFFNGIDNTHNEALKGLAEFRRIHGTVSAKGDRIDYELMYNATGKVAADLAETFEQRLREQADALNGRFEHFFEARRGRGRWWNAIIRAVPALDLLFASIVNDVQVRLVRSLASLLGNPPTSVAYEDHRARLDTLVLEGRKLVLVAHSQGNLFVNVASDYVRPRAASNSTQVIRIAPASLLPSNPQLAAAEQYTLADKDLVINGLLRLVAGVRDWTNEIPETSQRPAGSNGERDEKGHGLVEIYLNERMSPLGRIRSQINAAILGLKPSKDRALPCSCTADAVTSVRLYNAQNFASYSWTDSVSGLSGQVVDGSTVRVGIDPIQEGDATSPARLDINFGLGNGFITDTNLSTASGDIFAAMYDFKGVGTFELNDTINDSLLFLSSQNTFAPATAGIFKVFSVNQICTTADHRALATIRGSYVGRFFAPPNVRAPGVSISMNEGIFSARFLTCAAGFRATDWRDGLYASKDFSCIPIPDRVTRQ